LASDESAWSLRYTALITPAKTTVGTLFRGFQLLHGFLLLISAVGFFIFWARTRFWLPKYAHVLAAIGLVVGVWCVSNVPSNARLNKQGPVAKFLFALIPPATVYFFFVFYGGQKAAHRSKPKTAGEIADLIERFLNDTSLYPQEFNDFVDCSHPDKLLDSYRRRCGLLDPRDPEALEELRNMVQELRSR
jgi:hypothetical protein